MRFLKRFRRGLTALAHKARDERELNEELDAYLEMAIQRKMSNGLSRDEAARAARLEFGNVDAVKQDVRSIGWESSLETFIQDCRFGAWTLCKSPAFSTIAILTVAVGIAGTTTVFSVVRAVLLSPLP
jgi:putative ABC transport system permease protein